MRATESRAAELLVAGHRVARFLERSLGELGLSAGEAMVLSRLADQPLTMNGVMDALQIGASTATSLIDRLERGGLVVRVRNPADARSLLVEMTAMGQKKSAGAARAFTELDERLSAVSGNTLAGHDAFMRRLTEL